MTNIRKEKIRTRSLIQWIFAPIVVIVVFLGWKFPFLGFVVPVVMLTGIIVSIFNGRYSCGNLCPRGGFLDRMISPISRNVNIPAFFMDMRFRWIAFFVLMGFMGFQISENPSSLEHWGHVFWMMCAVTTALGVLLGVLYNPRTWCAFCPMGTAQNAIGGGTRKLEIIKDSCRGCRVCEKVCPMGIKIVGYIEDGQILSRDCLKCSECISVCPSASIKKAA